MTLLDVVTSDKLDVVTSDKLDVVTSDKLVVISFLTKKFNRLRQFILQL